MKQAMSNMDLTAIIRELQPQLINSRVTNIYQLDNNLFLFKLRKPRLTSSLLIQPGVRLHTTEYRLKTPQIPSNKAMILRRHLKGGHIQNINQYKSDRIIVISIQKQDHQYQLIIELFTKGILTIVQDNKVKFSLAYKKMRDRKHPDPSIIYL